MKRIIMTLAIAGALLGFGAPGKTPGLPLGPSAAKADGGFVAYNGGGGHRKGHHAGHGHHGKHHKKHHGHHRKHHNKHFGHHRKHHGKHYGHHDGRRRAFKHLKHAYRHGNRHSGYAGCHAVSKDGYWRGHHARIGGTKCYDHYGNGYVVKGSRYLVHYY